MDGDPDRLPLRPDMALGLWTSAMEAWNDAGSGHIAGIINPPGGKGTYWTNDAGEPGATAQAWRETATAHSGSWWTDWTAWLAERSGRKGKPPALGSAAHPPLADAPGAYVLET